MIQVLMIEDDVELAQLLQSRLYKDEIEVTIAPSPLEGLTLFQTKQFDLLVLDLSLPQMDGMEICRLIRQESAIPIIISSARSDIRDKMMGYSRGADDYLPKPYDPQELIFRMDAIMRLLMNIGSIKFESSLKSIDVIMGRIRQKIGDDPKNPHYIVSVRGVGYKFVNE